MRKIIAMICPLFFAFLFSFDAFAAEKAASSNKIMFGLLIFTGALLLIMIVIGFLSFIPKRRKSLKKAIELDADFFPDSKDIESTLENIISAHKKHKKTVIKSEEKATDDTEILTIDDGFGEKMSAKIRKSFQAKLIQSKDGLQEYYDEIKNELLSFDGVRSRVSWNFDSFSKGREPIAKIIIIGKTLALLLALDPSEFSESKYHHKDVGKTSKYAKVPTMLKIKSERSAKYAVELIGICMAKNGISKANYKRQNFIMPYESTKALIEKNLIKIVDDSAVDFDDENE